MSILDRFRLEGKVALVTGGSRGLGKAMARALAEAGAGVAVASRKLERVLPVAAEIPGESRGYECDVTVPDQVEALVENVLKDYGQIDILVNNAGLNIRGPIEKLSLAEFRQVQETNVTGVWLLCRAVAEHMKERRYGRVINIGSTQSLVAMAERTPYGTSKGALLMLTRSLALEWAPYGITVNAILPGPFHTEMNTDLAQDPQARAELAAMVPLGRWGELEEIGGAAVFLAGDAASYVTGAMISVDGGWTAR